MDFSRPKVFDVDEITSFLDKGSAVLFPTDTLPALAASPSNAHNLWKIKQRSLNKPLILMCSSTEQMLEMIPLKAIDDALEMAIRFWPGALTMVLPASGPLVNSLNKGTSTLGMRIPACSLARNLLSKSGPLATTSVNLSGSLPALTAEEASSYFPALPLLGPVPWPVGSGQASSVISWESKGCWKILRKGAVIPKSLKR